ncbi:ATP-dependent Clp protease ATP-binding subunit, partial [Candidatus Berkelbacteria bacterium]|nr:ATP-dependent Clp protease ATP-binding subunit [Candidatus Berkelbacteria bacterium]
DIFLQVLDDGRLTDALGQVADFRNAIIIATSNAGSNLIRQTIQSQTTATDMEVLSKQLLDLVQNEGTFRPEFLNRFDAVVAYRPLTVDELMSVVDRQLALINKRMEERHMTVVMQAPAKQKLAQLGFDPAFGARALVRAMTQTVENQLAQAILGGSVKSGGSFEVTQEMIQ